jgi:hypothetical protein
MTGSALRTINVTMTGSALRSINVTMTGSALRSVGKRRVCVGFWKQLAASTFSHEKGTFVWRLDKDTVSKTHRRKCERLLFARP